MKEGLFFSNTGEFVRRIYPLKPLMTYHFPIPAEPILLSQGEDLPDMINLPQDSVFLLIEHHGDRLVYREQEMAEK